MRYPRIRTVLLAGGLLILALPLTGIWLLRIYESALIRQTETELNAQAATFAAVFRLGWLAVASPDALPAMPAALPRPATSANDPTADARLPSLDLADDPVLPPPFTAAAPLPATPEPYAATVGRELLPVLRDTQKVTLAAIRLLDAKGVVVATTGEHAGASLADLQEVAAALTGTASATLRRRGQTRGPVAPWSISRGSSLRVFVAHPVVAEGRVLGAVLLSRTPATIEQALYGKRYQLALLAVVLVGSVVGVTFVTGRLISRPIRVVRDGAQRIAAGQAGGFDPPRGPMTREAAELATSIAVMAETLASRADYIRAFAADASHELKTPLAAMRGAVELLREHAGEMSAAERRHFLDNLASDVDRLERLVRRLLDLARAESRDRRGNARTAVAAVAGAVAQLYGERGLQIALEGGSDVQVAIDGDALSEVLAGLAENVVQHAPGAAARIAWRAERDETVVDFADDGPGISPANAPQIFDRFFTTARERGGTGLGLAIARARLATYGGGIELVPSSRGAAFRIRLRLATCSPPAPGA